MSGLRTFGAALDPVLVELRARPAIHVTEVLAALLRVCRAHEDFLVRHKVAHEHFAAVATLEARLARVCADHGRERWQAATLGALATELELAAQIVPPPLVALSAARWIERQHRAHLIHYFRDHDRVVHAGDPWPILDSPAGCYPRPTGNPQSRGRAADRGEWLTLVPEYTAGLEIRLRWCGPHLPVLRRGSRIAVGVLAKDVGDFEFDRLSPGGAPRFYRVRPRVPAYWARIEAVLAHAHAAGAEVLVLPELALTEELHARLLAHPLTAEIPLLVAGSRHVARDGDEPGRNVTTVIARGRVLAEHAKLSDFFFRDSGVDRFEHIHPGGVMTVLVSDRASALVLICKDVLRADWQHLTAQLAPRLLLVPSMTYEYSDFNAFAERMARDPQAHTFVANVGPAPAIVGRPCRQDPVIVMDSDVGRCVIYEIGEAVVNEISS